MRVLVVNLQDPASVTIRDALLEDNDWQEAGQFRGNPLWQRAYDIMVQVEGPSITDAHLSQDLADTGWPIDAVWFLSKHRAESGQPSLTVHPIGNHGEARFGGEATTLSPAAPRDMGALLRRMFHHAQAMNLPHAVTYEGTHHGPLMMQPSVFVEIGSDEHWYQDAQSGEAIASAVTDVLDGMGRIDGPITLGVGGGHYVPRQTTKALDGECDFGHLVPAYALHVEATDPAAPLERALDATPGATAVYMHKKGLKGPQRQVVRDWIAASGCKEL